ncbi:MAG: murein hydrolase activator EnvC family protein [bacterium]
MSLLKPAAIAGAVLLLLVGTSPLRVQAAANAGKIQKKILKNKKNLGEIERKLAEEKRRQTRDAQREKDVLNRLQQADRVLTRLKREKQANQSDLAQTQSETRRLHRQVEAGRSQLEQSRDQLRKRLRDLYRMSFQKPFLNGWLDSSNDGDLARKMKFEMLLAQSNEKLLDQTQRQNDELLQSSGQLDAQERRKERIVNALGSQEKTYDRQQRNRNRFLVSIRREQSLRKQTIQELGQAATDLKSKVAVLLKQSEEAKKKPSYVSAGQGLAVVRGRIPWPVSGTIVSFFGPHHNREFNATIVNTGIQIQAPAGTPFKAVAAGTVRYADWFKGYGKLVILDHGRGYYSLYAQASELSVSVGQVVAEGQPLGLVGDTGSLLGASSLYFEIRKNGEPQDPVRWLKRRALDSKD